MPTKRRLDAIVALAALGVALVAADNFEWITFRLAQQAARTFNYLPALWAPELLSILLAGGLVTLVWWQATRAAYPRVIDLLYLLAGLAAGILLAACTVAPAPSAPTVTALAATPTPVVGLGADDYAVYDAVIASNWPDPALIVMEAETTNRYNAGLSYESSQTPGLQKQTVDSFLAANQSTVALADRFQIRAPRVLLSQADKVKLFDRDLQASWQRFHAAYPSAPGLLAFSRAGFNANQTQALVYFQNGNGGLDAAGYVVLLARQPGGWVVKQQLMIWIA